ncbi:MAG: AraC family transcriptional regulator ligand-binding domain-containing protein, partial [Myxococcota bacterium]|nr:AraC family transcriptional regulator ligand-binding domain-containing protein [Myxococcota bacterium]
MSAAEHLVRFEHDDLEVLVLDLELPEPELPELTPSEREIAIRIADGLGNAEVAAERGVAVRTIANQVRSIFQKLGLCSRWELSMLLTQRALERGSRPAAPEVITTRRGARSDSRSGIVNSAATVDVLRTAYSTAGADFEDARVRGGISLVGDGALHREDYCALFEELAAITEQPGLGLELARALPIGTLGLLEWLSLSAPTLGDALSVVSEHGGLLHAGGRRVTRARGDQLAIAYWVEGARAPRVVVDWSFGCLYERLRATASSELEPIEVRVQYADPGDGRAEDFFGCRVRFGAAVNEIVVRRDVADLPLASADRPTFEILSGVAERRQQTARRPTLASRARDSIARAMESGQSPRALTTARRLGISRAALERGLADSHQRFDDLLAACRVDRAVRALEGT